MCEFYSPTGIVRRQLVSRHNVMIKPRLNIIAAGHPKRTIECLTGIALKSQDQKDQNDDGLFNRFLIAVAYKHRPNREIIEPNKKIPKLGHLFYLTKKLHRNTEEYIYNNEAKKFIKNVIYDYDILSSDKSNEDDFLASCYQKSMERVERLSLVLHILKICSRRLFTMLENIESFGILDDKFKIICTEQELNEDDHLIDYDTCFRASLLTKFYLNQIKILAGYDPITDHILLNKKCEINTFHLLSYPLRMNILILFKGLWDELSVFFGIFGSTRVDRTAYDRGLMCEFYSPTGIVRRQLVSRHNVMIKPRLNIIAAGHPKRTIECIALKSQDQKDQNDDGLFNRFLIAVAYKHRPNREIIEPNQKIPKLGHLFYLTKKLHRNTEEYIYNDEAKKFFKNVIYDYDILSSDKSNEDNFLASCYQKSMERIERLSLVLHILKICSRLLFNMLGNIESFGILDDKFKIICTEQELNEDDHLIDYDTCFRASLLTKFYLNQIKILAGYDPITDHILLNKKYSMNVPENEVMHIKKYIENHPSDRLLLSSLPANLKRKISKDQY
ncbi:unnamed protein product, partial [Adineta steineri]